MPVYTAKDYEEVLVRIQEKVAEKGIQMGECLSEDAIVAFEKSHNIRLPQGYRMFLQRVGNGCDCAEFPLNPLEGGEPRDLSHPFLLEEAWIWEDDDRDEDVIQEEIKTKVYQGEIELIDLGDCDCYRHRKLPGRGLEHLRCRRSAMLRTAGFFRLVRVVARQPRRNRFLQGLCV